MGGETMRWETLLVVTGLGVAGMLVVAPWMSASLARLASLSGNNPPVRGELLAPPAVAVLLRRACYDCHSNETRWPWYSRVAPVSWLLAHDVERGRQEVNFSEWSTYFPATRTRKLQWIERAVREQGMPPWPYRLLHPDARLTEQEVAVLDHWLREQIAALHITQHQE